MPSYLCIESRQPLASRDVEDASRNGSGWQRSSLLFAIRAILKVSARVKRWTTALTVGEVALLLLVGAASGMAPHAWAEMGELAGGCRSAATMLPAIGLLEPLERLLQRFTGEGCDMMGGGSGRPAPEQRDVQSPAPSSETVLVATGRQVYAASCAVCHGVRGDGRGMAAHMFATPPRDFRAGVFKFRSTPSGSLPRDADLLRVLQRGVRRTAMVAQTHLSAAEQRAVIAYLKTFSPRWQQEEPAPPVPIPEPLPRTPTRLVQGQQLYEQAGCAQCHGPAGRGDGPRAGDLTDDWGWPIRPANLQRRPLKSGSTLQDIYRTLAAGLDGTPMPALGEALPAEELWALVYYVEALAPREAHVNEETLVGEESRGRMAERMHGMMGDMPMMERMMRRQPMRE